MTVHQHWYRFAAGLMAVIALFSLPAQSFALRSEQPVIDGVKYVSEQTSSGAKIRAIIVNTTRARVSMEGPSGTSCSQSYNASDFTGLDSQDDFVAAINALFIVDGKASGDYIGNKVFLGTAPSQWNVSVDHSGRIQIGNGQLTAANKGNYSMFMRGGYRIGDPNGKSFSEMNDADVAARFAQIYASHPENRTSAIARTFLGVNPAANELILLTGGAGENRNTEGVSSTEAVQYLKTLGATEAFTLDGGSSTFMRVKDRFVAGVSTLPSGGGLDSLLVVRSGANLTEAQANALPVLDCRSNNDTPTQAGANTAATGTTNTTTQGGTAVTSTVQQGTSAVVGAAVPLEIPINGVTSITGEQNYIITYSRILFTFFAGLAGLLALLMLIVSGFQIIIGGPDQITKAKERIAGSIAGLILLATSGFVLYMINPCFYSFSSSSACAPRGIVGQEYQAPAGGSTNNGTTQGSNSAAPNGATAAQPNRPRTPVQYANEKISEAQSRWSQYSADFIGMKNVTFRDAPAEVFLGFASNGGITELTPGGSFRAMGMFGVETGPGPAPAPVAGTADRWISLSTDADVQRFLGRAATTEPDAWKTAIRDQIAVGYVNLREHGIRVMNALPVSIRTTNYSSSWFIAMAAMGWSAGDGTAARIVAPFAPQLASVSDSDKWGRFVKLIADAGTNGTTVPRVNTSGRFDSHGEGDTPTGRYDTHDNPFYSVVRTMQKLEAGYLLAQRNNSEQVNFFAYPEGIDRAAVQQTMTNLGYYGVATR